MLSTFITSGQQLKPILTMEGLANRIDDNVFQDKNYPDSACLQRLILVKFKLNQQLGLDSIELNANTPPEFTKVLKNAIFKTFTESKIDKRLRRLLGNRTLIYPFIVEQYASCEYARAWPKAPQDSLKSSVKGRWQFMYRDQLFQSLDELLHFNNKQLTYLDCIILYPSGRESLQ